MGTSYVEFRGYGFWASDGVLAFWLLALVDAIDGDGAPAEWVAAYRDHLHAHGTAGLVGCIDPRLVDVIGDDEPRRERMLRWADEALRSIEARAFGPRVRAAGIDEVTPALITQLIRVGELFSKLLQGELRTLASSPIDDR